MTETSAKIVLHSVAHTHDHPLVTMQLVYPRFIHSEFMTHRVFSRNAMSSRAVPVAKMIEQVRTNPAMPIHWGANQPGMQANGEVNAEAKQDAQILWYQAANIAANVAEVMSRDLGLHKQVVNRILEPYQWMHTIVTATEWDNFFSLRLDAAAEPNMRRLAEVMRDAIKDSKAVERTFHAPYVSDDEMKQLNPEQAALVSAARCARVSYLNHDGTAPSIEKDLALADTLRTSQHASPFEHQAWALSEAYYHSRNFRGWEQFRERITL
jgi:thymidylate synthase ThyX